MSEESDFKVGDIIQIHDGPSVPRELRGKYFRVEAAEGEPGHVRAWKLSLPYVDAACTQRYYAAWPSKP